MNFKYLKTKASGTSLMETVIYLAIFTVMSIVVINSFIIIVASMSLIKTNHDLLGSGQQAMERISYEIRNSKNIDLTNSTFDSNESVLRLIDADGSSYVVIEKNNSNIKLSNQDGFVGNLISNNLSANSLVFRKISTTNSEAVKIEIELQDNRGKEQKIERFYNTVILRGGY